jgi:hypothetical protein
LHGNLPREHRRARRRPAAIAGTFAREYRAGTYRGLRSSTSKALRDLAQGAHGALSGRTGE